MDHEASCWRSPWPWPGCWAGPEPRVLVPCEAGTTTGQLARALGVSAASVSEQVKALRAASLVASRRDGSRVVHTLSPLGLHSCTARLPPPCTDSARPGVSGLGLTASPTRTPRCCGIGTRQALRFSGGQEDNQPRGYGE
ncbi:hypothetical protein DMH15_08440 [Streptomyces sp. WAC 06725]|nr:hypothetical protein DMH15_08440 [Streptomyces sp. WAC 06725]